LLLQHDITQKQHNFIVLINDFASKMKYSIHFPTLKSMRNFTWVKRVFLTVFVVTGLAVLTGCSNMEVITPCLTGHTYGFLGGLLHGFIAPFDLIAMLFRDDITVYAPNNNGAWYAFGFLLGSGGWGFFGGNRSSRRKG
jgi:hypothetical protein